jgi:hypothetical protein
MLSMGCISIGCSYMARSLPQDVSPEIEVALGTRPHGLRPAFLLSRFCIGAPGAPLEMHEPARLRTRVFDSPTGLS